MLLDLDNGTCSLLTLFARRYQACRESSVEVSLDHMLEPSPTDAVTLTSGGRYVFDYGRPGIESSRLFVLNCHLYTHRNRPAAAPAIRDAGSDQAEDGCHPLFIYMLLCVSVTVVLVLLM